jgi:murein DD-endopeptidase MepM/ murein hydrolase activator NlpD
MKKTPYRVICTLGTLFLLIVANHVVFAQSITQGLVAYYPFEGNTNDYSGKGNNGTIAGGVTFAAGQVGQGASFDGTTGSISVPDNASLQLSTFTLAAWVFPTSITGGNRIVEKGSSNSYWLDVNPSRQVLVGFYDGAYHDLIGPVLAINTWHFIAGTYDGNVLRLYVDDVLVNSTALISRPAPNAEPLVIGWKFGGITSDHFAGRIDELQIYNRALSPAELQLVPCHLYTATSAPAPFPDGRGVPWNVFDPTRLLVRASCSDVSVTANVGTNQNEYIFNQGYQWDGTTWNQFSFTCTGQTSDPWCIGTAQATLSANTLFYVAYTCTWTGSAWKCGCRDQTCAQNFWQLQGIQAPFLEFPLANRTSATAVINSIFYHSMPSPYCPNASDVVTAYTGEQGRKEFGTSWVRNSACGAEYGFAKDLARSNFVVNGHYSGAGAPNFLYYEGHPGFDYKTNDQNSSGKIDVHAAAAGTVVCVVLRITPDGADMDRIQNPDACTEGPAQGEIKIDHGNGYFSIYLHLSSAAVNAKDPVLVGDKIGVSGETGAPGAPHLHFEVRKKIDNNFIAVDPYGWQGSYHDPYNNTGTNQKATNVNLWRQ